MCYAGFQFVEGFEGNLVSLSRVPFSSLMASKVGTLIFMSVLLALIVGWFFYRGVVMIHDALINLFYEIGHDDTLEEWVNRGRRPKPADDHLSGGDPVSG